MADLITRVIISKGIKLDREYKNVLDFTENQMLSLMLSNNHLVAQTTKASFVNPTRNNKSTIYIFTMFARKLYSFSKSKLFK